MRQAGRALGKCRQLYQIIFRHRLQMSAGFAPCGETANDDKRVEAFFLQQMRHPGAGRFACSSTVEVNVLIFGEIFDLLVQIVGFDADRPGDSLRSYVVIAVTAHVDD